MGQYLSVIMMDIISEPSHNSILSTSIMTYRLRSKVFFPSKSHIRRQTMRRDQHSYRSANKGCTTRILRHC